MDPKALGRQPAAPFSAYEEEIKVKPTQHTGLTKREAAAIAAMQGLIAAGNSKLPGIGPAPVTTAEVAVMHADALMAELAKDGAQ